MKLIALGVIGIVLILAAAFFIRLPDAGEQGIMYTGLLITERVVEYPITVQIIEPGSEEIGVALEYDELDFGILQQGMVARKEINLGSNDMPVKVSIWATGDIKGMVSFSSTEVYLDGPDSVEVRIDASETGNFSGNVMFSSRVYNYRWLDWANPIL